MFYDCVNLFLFIIEGIESRVSRIGNKNENE